MDESKVVKSEKKVYENMALSSWQKTVSLKIEMSFNIYTCYYSLDPQTKSNLALIPDTIITFIVH